MTPTRTAPGPTPNKELDAAWIDVVADGEVRWSFEVPTTVTGFEARSIKGEGFCERLMVANEEQLAAGAISVHHLGSALILPVVRPHDYLTLQLKGFRGEIRPVGFQKDAGRYLGRINRIAQTLPMTLALDEREIVVYPDQIATTAAWPQRLFRVDLLYLECDGLLINEVRVSSIHQPIERGTPAAFFNENGQLRQLQKDLAFFAARDAPLDVADLRTALKKATEHADKGRTVRFDTAEPGNRILIEFFNPTREPIVAKGCYTGLTVQ